MHWQEEGFHVRRGAAVAYCIRLRTALHFGRGNESHDGMVSKILWVLLTVVFTFLFMVLYENGFTNYVENCQTEYQQIRTYFGTPPHKKADNSDKLE